MTLEELADMTPACPGLTVGDLRYAPTRLQDCKTERSDRLKTFRPETFRPSDLYPHLLHCSPDHPG